MYPLCVLCDERWMASRKGRGPDCSDIASQTVDGTDYPSSLIQLTSKVENFALLHQTFQDKLREMERVALRSAKRQVLKQQEAQSGDGKLEGESLIRSPE